MVNDKEDIDAWMKRMDQLLLSSPNELMSFVGDAILSLAARSKDETEDPYEAIIQILRKAGEEGRDTIIDLVRRRMGDITAHLSEHADDTRRMVNAAYHLSRTGEWPDDSS